MIASYEHWPCIVSPLQLEKCFIDDLTVFFKHKVFQLANQLPDIRVTRPEKVTIEEDEHGNTAS